LKKGVNLVDTAEQYPIPSDRARPEGTTEKIIGSWMKQDPARRDKLAGPFTSFPQYDKVRQSVTSKSKSKKHGPITGPDQSPAFAHNTLTHFVIPLPGQAPLRYQAE
jgi:hypothetical protein